MNFIFISPQFPRVYWNFCDRLKKKGVNVLGIGDTPYDQLTHEVRESLTEYYFVPSLADYDQMMRAVAFFTFKYGRIDWLESNNEYWLESDAHLRTDFNIRTGWQSSDMEHIKNKSALLQEGRHPDGTPLKSDNACRCRGVPRRGRLSRHR